MKMYWKNREVLSRPLLLSVELSFVLFCCKQIQFEILTSKEIICIKADCHLDIASSSTMMLKLLTAMVIISSIGAKKFLVETEGK